MRIHHIALVCRSEENADRFYRVLLGLERTRSFTVPVELSRGLFGVDRTFQAITYLKDEMTAEVFVVEEAPAIIPHLHHVGLEVEDRKRFLDKGRKNLKLFNSRCIRLSRPDPDYAMFLPQIVSAREATVPGFRLIRNPSLILSRPGKLFPRYLFPQNISSEL